MHCWWTTGTTISRKPLVKVAENITAGLQLTSDMENLSQRKPNMIHGEMQQEKKTRQFAESAPASGLRPFGEAACIHCSSCHAWSTSHSSTTPALLLAIGWHWIVVQPAAINQSSPKVQTYQNTGPHTRHTRQLYSMRVTFHSHSHH